MTLPEHITSLDRDGLLALVAELQRQIAELTARNEALQAENERIKRGSKGQAAPFSKGKRVDKPKRPGRKPGSGTFRFRQAPRPDQITEPPVEVKVTLETCPDCGGQLEEERVDLAYKTDIPEFPRPKVTQYRVSVCRCRACGKQVRGQHPEVAPDQYGATAHRVGDRAMAAAHALHYGAGIPVRKVPAVLEILSGIELTQGAITQDAMQRAQGEIGETYEGLRGDVPQSPSVYTDDTGWRVGGEPAFLMVFETEKAIVYQIRPRHRHQEVQEIIPPDYEGVMVTDRGRSYDDSSFNGVDQQKCLSHVLQSVSSVLEIQKGRARDFGERLKELLQETIQVWRSYHAGEVTDFASRAQRMKEEITHHLRDRFLKNPDNRRLLNQIGSHHDRGNLLRFLDDPRIEPTNNRAERALRPAVIARKVSQCSKNLPGAYAFSAFTSVVRTLAKNGFHAVVEGLHLIFLSARTQRASP